MTRSATALLTLLVFAAAVLVIAAWAGRRTHGAADFAIANRRLGAWSLGLGYCSAAVNPWLMLILGASAFSWGLAAVWVWAAIVVGCIVNLWFVAPRVRALSASQGSVTLTQAISAESGDRLMPLVVRSAVFRHGRRWVWQGHETFGRRDGGCCRRWAWPRRGQRRGDRG